MKLKKKRVLVIGLGLSGRAAASFLLKRQAYVWGVDDNLELLKNHQEIKDLITLGLVARHEAEKIEIQDFDFIVVSPGVPPSNPHYIQARQADIEIFGEVELAARFINQPLLAITGTNGKTTTTLLVAHVLNASGKAARALGNLGAPLTTELDALTVGAEEDILVAELSSFQLETLQSAVIDAGVVLNITPDHLDRYPDLQTYAATKLHLKDCLKPEGNLYVYEAVYNEYKKLLGDFKPLTYGYSSSCDFYLDPQLIYGEGQDPYPLPLAYQDVKNHDVENMLAAYALCKERGVNSEQFFNALSTFKKPAHRLEFVRSFKEIAYYDDSKGTNVDAVIRAVTSLKGEIILIAGGVDKGAAYTPWIKAFAGYVKYVFAIGQAAMKIKNDLSFSLPVEERSTLEAAIKDATALAKPGQVVLLSPGCSSFDMFRDYVHRGEEFKRIVNTLE
ncbi:UDP-N-acetylmuramoylalanine--D-glutamate ligase [Neochlamydia sp. TUME1]|uniref:UDP-N-acetylmuramoyl-L-alanine--D-glutamate ligase n=1 Tax=Neochlamydia sp. TUME1 TaxID=1478174 RepID=UPI00057CDA0F|nr:UDP-N-acetylmuramoyl-L-alanine--D-glutamate ligase [Neochlamydia sp. TUME1]KIC76652.1 UDP-N-acetylmuramoylalanine--D-glutamate ligase [Neochlamydia sp. TUME1]